MLAQLWRIYDRAYVAVHGLQDLDVHGRPYLRVGVSRCRWRPIRLADGTVLRPGDRVLVIHLHNQSLAGLAHRAPSRVAAGLALRRILHDGLTMLAERLTTDPALANVRAVGALTNLWRGGRWLGFDAYPLRTRRWARLVGAYQQRLRLNGTPPGSVRVARRPDDRHEARLIWMSTATLLRRYAPPASRAPNRIGAFPTEPAGITRSGPISGRMPSPRSGRERPGDPAGGSLAASFQALIFRFRTGFR